MKVWQTIILRISTKVICKGLLLAREFFQGYGQRAFFKVNLFRSAEPQHIFPPSCNSFYIDQVANANVFRYGIAAPAAAAQGQGRGQAEVIQVADAALCRGSIHQNAACFHSLGECIELVGGGAGAQVDGCGVICCI